MRISKTQKNRMNEYGESIYQNKTVMKVKSDETSKHTRICLRDVPYDFTNNGMNLWTSVPVEGRIKLCI